jgi:hypothetical protein
MNTYIKTAEGHAAIRASRAEVSKLAQVRGGEWTIAPATAALRAAAARNAEVKTLRILADGRTGHL